MIIEKINSWQRKCPQCGRVFISKHGNRLFCPAPTEQEKREGKRDCKVVYNNSKSKRIRDKIKEPLAAALTNFKILDNLFKKGIFIVKGEHLQAAGLDPSKITGRVKDVGGNLTIPVFFKYKLMKIGNNQFKIEEV